MSQSQEAGVPTPKFGLAKTAAEAKKIAEDIAGNDLVQTYTHAAAKNESFMINLVS